jgi:subtilisin family serine protease
VRINRTWIAVAIVAALMAASAPSRFAQQREFVIPPDEMPVQFDQASGQPLLRESTALIRVPEARKEFNVSGDGLAAAVLDTGLRASHVDFHRRVPVQVNFTGDNGGRHDDAADGQGHGTNVAGIIAAREEPRSPGAPRGEHTGVAPAAAVVPMKVLSNSGRGDFVWVEQALAWVVANHAKYGISIVNMSLGAGNNPDSDATLADDPIRARIRELRALRIPVVVAAGNDYFRWKDQGMSFPAILRETVSVGAVYDANVGSRRYLSGAVAHNTARNRITPFSQRLHESRAPMTRTDIFAPGAAVTSSGINNDRGESVQEGTSQAAPMTAGVILLMQEYHRRVRGQLPSVDELETWLRAGAMQILDDCSGCDNVPHTRLSFGRIDAVGALQAMKAAIAP